MEHLHLKRVLGITDMLLDPLEEGVDLGQVVLGLDLLLQQNVNGPLANIKVFRSGSDQRLYVLNRFLRSTPTLGNMTEKDLRRGERYRCVPLCGWIMFSVHLEIPVRQTMWGFASTRPTGFPAIRRLIHV